MAAKCGDGASTIPRGTRGIGQAPSPKVGRGGLYSVHSEFPSSSAHGSETISARAGPLAIPRGTRVQSAEAPPSVLDEIGSGGRLIADEATSGSLKDLCVVSLLFR